jgi:hypothetical protein
VAIIVPTNVEDLGRAFTQVARNNPLTQEIWLTVRRDGVHLWLLIQHATDDDERQMYRLLDPLDEHFSDTDFQLHILNPASYTVDLHEVLPRDARKLFSRAVGA